MEELLRIEVNEPDRTRHWLVVEEGANDIYLSHEFDTVYGVSCLTGMSPTTAMRIGEVLVRWGSAHGGTRPEVPESLTLPDDPDTWAEVDNLWEGHFVQRWMPGAFGDRDTIEGFTRFKVTLEEWAESPEPSAHNPNALPERTILKGEIF